MTPEIMLVLGIIAVTICLFITEKIRVDLVAVLVMGIVVASGLLTPEEGVAGFANSATVTVAAMFILSAGLQRTGAVNRLGRQIVRLAGQNEFRLLFFLMVVIAGISGFINNTAAVAVFMPLTLSVAQDVRISASRLLIPLSFAAMFGGVATLIGTSTNILVHSIAQEHGVGGFTMFEFLPLGLVSILIGTTYMLLIGRHFIPDRQPVLPLTERYELREYLSEVVIPEESPLLGKTLEEAQLGTEHDLTIIDIIRDQRDIRLPGTSRRLLAGDILLVRGDVRTLIEISELDGWQLHPVTKIDEQELEDQDYVMAEAAIAPSARLVGETLRTIDFRRRYGAIVLGIQRRGAVIRKGLAQVRLQPGDLLLLYGKQEDIQALQNIPDFLLLVDIPDERLRNRKAPVALALVALVVLLSALEIMPIVGAAVLASVLMVLFGVLSLEEAYQALDAKVLVMLAGILSLGFAMDKSGTAAYLADIAVSWTGPYGPVALLATFYLMTTLLTETMSNNATAVLIAPIAISVATELGVSPKPFLVAVTFAASASFMTPIGYQTNTMIYGPGGYRFSDFARVGAPLNLLFWLTAVVVIPIFWKF